MSDGRRDRRGPVRTVSSAPLCGWMCFGVAMACLGAAWSTAGAQNPPAQPEAAVQHVRGVVVNSIDMKPIARALVSSGDQRMAVMTDDEGRFSFDVRHPGASSGPSTFAGGFLNGMGGGSNQMTVFLMVRRPGYTDRSLPVPIQFTSDGSSGPDVTLKLVPECILRGHVSAPSDLPPGLFVQLRRKVVQEGFGVWMQAAGTQVDSHGDFRVGELQPGDYKVMLAASTVRRMNPSQLVGSSPGYLPAFSGDAPDLASAAVIHLGAGQTVEADLNLRAATFYRVTIPIANLPLGTGFSAAVGPSEDGSSGFQLMVNPQNHQIDTLLPNGAYDVRVSASMNAGPLRMADGGPVPVQLNNPQPRIQLMGSGRVEVSGAAVSAPAISLAPEGTIPVIVHEEHTGTQQNDASAAQAWGQVGFGSLGRSIRPLEINLRLMGSVGRGANLRNPASDDADEPLVLENVVAGTYQVIATAHQGYVASIQSNGVDLLREPLVVGPGGAASPIEVTIRDDPATLTATVASGIQTNVDPLAIYFMCIPLDEPFGRAGLGGSTSAGKMQLGNLAPGRYVVVAFRNPMEMQSLEYRNPDVLRDLQAKGTVVTLSAGQKSEIQVPLLPDEGS